MPRKVIRLLDVTIDNLSKHEIHQRTLDMLDEPRFHHVVTPGPEFLLEATADRRYRDILNRADLSLPDGMGLHVGARLTGQRLQQRYPGVEYVEDLLHLAAQRQLRVFLIGGGERVAERAAEVLLQRYPGMVIVGIESEKRGSWQKLHERRLIERIHLARPNILLVAFGTPKQELWIERHRAALHDVRLAIGVGRTFDYLSGRIRRPPAFARRVGLEWLYTFLTAKQFYQPHYRRQRVINATYRFIIEVVKHRRKPHYV